ncbi:MAG: hypothetical protein A2X84_09095 [Desulfuromonadaceae bacterium GWC2_58_13]|nr:MAG: hypothetical protein A2X84_09095 [Desulfuromonadaceae bacterium GWC2_58_13]
MFTIWFIFAQYILATDDVHGMEALLKSREYVRGHSWGVAGRVLLLAAVGTLVALIPIIGPLLNLLLVPFTLIYYHEIFKDLREIKGSVSYIASPGAKIKWLAAGAAGYLIVPAIGLALLGPSLLQGWSHWTWNIRNEGGILQSSSSSVSTASDQSQLSVEVTGEESAGAEPDNGPHRLDLGKDRFEPGEGAVPEPSPATVYVPLTGDDPDQVMVYVFAINYRGSVRFDGKEIYPIEGERDMSYNYTGNLTLNRGSNTFEVDYQALPDPWMTEIKLKVFSHDWKTGEETVHGEWIIKDTEGRQSYEVVLGD